MVTSGFSFLYAAISCSQLFWLSVIPLSDSVVLPPLPPPLSSLVPVPHAATPTTSATAASAAHARGTVYPLSIASPPGPFVTGWRGSARFAPREPLLFRARVVGVAGRQGGQLRARADPELGVDPGEVDLDRL